MCHFLKQGAFPCLDSSSSSVHQNVATGPSTFSCAPNVHRATREKQPTVTLQVALTSMLSSQK